MRVKVVEVEQDPGGKWTYQLEDEHSTLVDNGKFFSEAELSNSGE